MSALVLLLFNSLVTLVLRGRGRGLRGVLVGCTFAGDVLIALLISTMSYTLNTLRILLVAHVIYMVVVIIDSYHHSHWYFHHRRTLYYQEEPLIPLCVLVVRVGLAFCRFILPRSLFKLPSGYRL